MEEVLVARLKQHQEVREVLRATGQKIIRENSKIDNFWGIGADGKGRNELGKIWMKLRVTNR